MDTEPHHHKPIVIIEIHLPRDSVSHADELREHAVWLYQEHVEAHELTPKKAQHNLRPAVEVSHDFREEVGAYIIHRDF